MSDDFEAVKPPDNTPKDGQTTSDVDGLAQTIERLVMKDENESTPTHIDTNNRVKRLKKTDTGPQTAPSTPVSAPPPESRFINSCPPQPKESRSARSRLLSSQEAITKEKKWKKTCVKKVAEEIDNLLTCNDATQDQEAEAKVRRKQLADALCDSSSKVRNLIGNVEQSIQRIKNLDRYLDSVPHIPQTLSEDVVSEKAKLRVASWNFGELSMTNKETVLTMLVEVIKADVIFLQEVRATTFDGLKSVAEVYNMHCLSPKRHPDTGNASYGLFILYKKELEQFVCNARGNCNTDCEHSEKNEKSSDGQECEYVSIDILMKDGQFVRLVCLYHGSQGLKNCPKTVSDFLKTELCYDQERKISILVMGDGNLQKFGGNKYLPDFMNEMAKSAKLESALPLEWNTLKYSSSESQPDIVYTNVKKTDLNVHKPFFPFHFIEKIVQENYVGINKETKKIQALNRSNFIRKKTKKQSTQIKNDKDVPPLSPVVGHYILVADIGTAVGTDERYHCCDESWEKEMCSCLTPDLIQPTPGPSKTQNP